MNRIRIWVLSNRNHHQTFLFKNKLKLIKTQRHGLFGSNSSRIFKKWKQWATSAETWNKPLTDDDDDDGFHKDPTDLLRPQTWSSPTSRRLKKRLKTQKLLSNRRSDRNKHENSKNKNHTEVWILLDPSRSTWSSKWIKGI